MSSWTLSAMLAGRPALIRAQRPQSELPSTIAFSYVALRMRYVVRVVLLWTSSQTVPAPPCVWRDSVSSHSVLAWKSEPISIHLLYVGRERERGTDLLFVCGRSSPLITFSPGVDEVIWNLSQQVSDGRHAFNKALSLTLWVLSWKSVYGLMRIEEYKEYAKMLFFLEGKAFLWHNVTWLIWRHVWLFS